MLTIVGHGRVVFLHGRCMSFPQRPRPKFRTAHALEALVCSCFPLGPLFSRFAKRSEGGGRGMGYSSAKRPARAYQTKTPRRLAGGGTSASAAAAVWVDSQVRVAVPLVARPEKAFWVCLGVCWSRLCCGALTSSIWRMVCWCINLVYELMSAGGEFGIVNVYLLWWADIIALEGLGR